MNFFFLTDVSANLVKDPSNLLVLKEEVDWLKELHAHSASLDISKLLEEPCVLFNILVDVIKLLENLKLGIDVSSLG
jgi:hypothetical protein